MNTNVTKELEKQTSTSNSKYVVKRDGFRVSDTIHESKEAAKSEYDYWYTLSKKDWPDGTKIEIIKV
jgi:hypothetical protein